MDKKKTRYTVEGYGEVSPAVIKRLPRYFRYLRELIRNGKLRISSGELSEMMHVTASQIRQDLNCFGGFGQQGYGYNVNYLYAKICEILGVGEGFRAVVIGTGNLGRALVRSPMFEKRGVDIVAMFDVAENLVGTTVAGVGVCRRGGRALGEGRRLRHLEFYQQGADLSRARDRGKRTYWRLPHDPLLRAALSKPAGG